MTTAAPNEPTEGAGGAPVFDMNGLYVGRVKADEPEPPSEDLARVLVALSPEAVSGLALDVDRADFEATWLVPEGDRLVLDRPLDVALREQGFDI